MKIEIDENIKNMIKKYENLCLFDNRQNDFYFYTNVKFEEEQIVKNGFFGEKIINTIYLTSCKLIFYDEKEELSLRLTDEGVASFFKYHGDYYNINYMRKNYLSLKNKMEGFYKMVDNINKRKVVK